MTKAYNGNPAEKIHKRYRKRLHSVSSAFEEMTPHHKVYEYKREKAKGICIDFLL